MKVKSIVELPYRSVQRMLMSLLKITLFAHLLAPKQGLLTVANLVSASRVLLGAVVAYLTYYEFSLELRLSFMAVGAFTDLLDGAIAQIEGPSDLGAVIDPVCDKIFIVLCGIGYFKSMPNPGLIKLLLIFEVLFLIFPVAGLIVALIKHEKADLRSGIWGKARFGSECLAVILMIFGFTQASTYVLYVSLALVGATAADVMPTALTFLKKIFSYKTQEN